MNIEIKHMSNTFNYGSCMMGINIIVRLNKEIEGAKFYVDAAKDEDLERLKKETGVEDIYFANSLYSRNKIVRLAQKGIKSLLRKKSVLLVIGGDDISEYYGYEYLESIVRYYKKISKIYNIFLVGQTMGPFTGERIQLVRECLRESKIYTRDDKCYKYLKDLNFNNVNKGRDLAFISLPNNSKPTGIMEKYNITKDEYITIVPSGLTECYTKNKDNYIKEQINIITNLLDNNKLKDKKLVLLPHVTLPKSVDDTIIVKEIMNNIDASLKARIVAIEDNMLPSEAREILSNGVFTITGRMHAAVSTFYMRKPAISLSYSVKYSGVIGDGLDLGELIVEAAGDEQWTENKISKAVAEIVEYTLNNYDMLIRKIDKKVSESSELAEKQLDELVLDIKINS